MLCVKNRDPPPRGNDGVTALLRQAVAVASEPTETAASVPAEEAVSEPAGNDSFVVAREAQAVTESAVMELEGSQAHVGDTKLHAPGVASTTSEERRAENLSGGQASNDIAPFFWTGAIASSFPPAFTAWLVENDVSVKNYEVDDVPRFVRTHPLFPLSLSQLKEQLGPNVKPVSWLDGYFELPARVKIASSEAYRKGHLYGIDVSSGAAVAALAPRPHEHVLDLCCAPGAKLCALADAMRAATRWRDADGGDHGGSGAGPSTAPPPVDADTHTAAAAANTAHLETAAPSTSAVASAVTSAVTSAAPSAAISTLASAAAPSATLSGSLTGSVTGVDVSAERLAACRTLCLKYALPHVRLFNADGASFAQPPPMLKQPPPTRVSCAPDSAGGAEACAADAGAGAGAGAGVGAGAGAGAGAGGVCVADSASVAGADVGSNGDTAVGSDCDGDIADGGAGAGAGDGGGADGGAAARPCASRKRRRREERRSDEPFFISAALGARLATGRGAASTAQPAAAAATAHPAAATADPAAAATAGVSSAGVGVDDRAARGGDEEGRASSRASIAGVEGVQVDESGRGVEGTAHSLDETQRGLDETAHSLDETGAHPGFVGYDKVLVDAECTHDGSIKHLAKFSQWGWETFERRFLQPERIETLQALQLSLLRRGFALLRPGGTLVYSTCSFARAQNEAVVSSLLRDEPTAEVQPIPELRGAPCKQGAIAHTLRFEPCTSRTSALFIAKLRKKD